MKSDKGFTLLELMVTLTIGGVLVAIGVPGMVNFVRNSRIATEANAFVTTLATARGEAMKRGRPVVVCKSATESAAPTCTDAGNWESGWVMYVDNSVPTNTALDAGDTVLTVQGKFGSANTLVGNNNVVNRVIFSPKGVVGAGFGSFTLRDTRPAPAGLRLICMARTGRTRTFSDGKTACPAEDQQ